MMSIHSDSDITAASLCVKSRKTFAKRNCAVVRKNLTAFPENFHRFPGENIQNVRYAPCRRFSLYSSIGLLLLLKDVDSIQDSMPSVGQKDSHKSYLSACLGTMDKWRFHYEIRHYGCLLRSATRCRLFGSLPLPAQKAVSVT